MKKLFIVGCSYTHWSDGDCFGESYPALIAKEYPNWHVYDASEPGGSNDSVYLRLRYLEKLYGAPDKIIVQWTHLPRTTVVTDEFIPRDFKHNTVENYTYCEQSVNDKNFPSVTIVDTNNEIVIGDVDYTSSNIITVTFNNPFAGCAFLNSK